MKAPKKLTIALAIFTFVAGIYGGLFLVGLILHKLTGTLPRWYWFSLAFLLGMLTVKLAAYCRLIYRELIACLPQSN